MVEFVSKKLKLFCPIFEMGKYLLQINIFFKTDNLKLGSLKQTYDVRGRDGEVGGAVEDGPGEGEGGAGADREAVVERHRGIPGTRLIRVLYS